MATSPTFVADYEGPAWNTTTSPKTTGSFNGSLGDVLVALVADANDDGAENFTITSSPAETWTEDAETSGQTSADVWMQSMHTILTAARTGMTVTSTRTAGAGTDVSGVDVAHFTGSDGIGAVAKVTGNGVAAPSLSITTSFANSAIVYMVADWAATDATTRTHRTVNGFTPTAGNGQELAYFRDTVNWMVVAAYIPDAGAAGAKSVGISAPAAGDCLVVAVEVRGSTAAAAIPPILVMQTRRPF